MKRDSNLKPLKASYPPFPKCKILNNGHTAQFSPVFANLSGNINIFQLVFKDMNLQIALIFSRRIELIHETNVTHSYECV